MLGVGHIATIISTTVAKYLHLSRLLRLPFMNGLVLSLVQKKKQNEVSITSSPKIASLKLFLSSLKLPPPQKHEGQEPRLLLLNFPKSRKLGFVAGGKLIIGYKVGK